MLFPGLKITSLSSMHSSPTEVIQAIASLTCQSYPTWFFINDTCRLYPAGHWHHERQAAAAAKSLQSCLILFDPIHGSPPGSLIPGILKARTLEWITISFSNAWKWTVKVKSLSRVRPLAWTAAYQAPLSMGFSRQEYWSGVPLSSPWKTGASCKMHEEQSHTDRQYICSTTFWRKGKESIIYYNINSYVTHTYIISLKRPTNQISMIFKFPF